MSRLSNTRTRCVASASPGSRVGCKKRGARNSATVAARRSMPRIASDTPCPPRRSASELVARLAAQITAIDQDLAELDVQIDGRFEQHRGAEILLSMPGFGPVLAATFLANIGGNLDGVRHRRPAGQRRRAGARCHDDSGRISGNLHRPRRFNRRLMRTCYLAALSSLKNSPASRALLRPQKQEGKSHKQALIALARRRINVIWAMLRDHTHLPRTSPHSPAA